MPTSTVTKLCHLVRLLWLDAPLGDRVDAWAHLSMLILLQVIKGKIGTVISWSHRRQLEAFGHGSNWQRVLRACVLHISALLALSPVEVLFRGLLRRLRFKWSRFLTVHHFLPGYVRTHCDNHSGSTPNLDQQIAEDVDKFVGLLLDLGFDIFEGIVHLSFLVRLLSDIAPALGPTVVACAAFGTALTGWLGRRLPELHSAARGRENDYRYVLTRVRENAEPVVLYGGERFEEARLSERHAEMQGEVEKVKACRDRVEWFSTTFRKVAAIAPAFALGNVQVDGHGHEHGHGHHGHRHGHEHGEEGTGSLVTRVGGFVQASDAFDHILFHLLLIAENLNDFSKLSSLIESLDAMKARYDSMRRVDSEQLMKDSISLVDALDTGPFWLSAKGLTLRVPTQRGQTRVLVEGLDFDVRKGESLLVQGSSGVGKTTLLRAIAGLWRLGSGTIRLPPGGSLFYIPQAPYMCIGSLRQQVMYPLDETTEWSKSCDEEIERVLRKVNLGRLLEQKAGEGVEGEKPLDRIERWAELLSIGEQQRMGFARLLFAKPMYAILDEATSACDEENESNLYMLLRDTCKGWLSIGHRSSIEQFHSAVIQLTPPSHENHNKESR